MSGVYEYKNPTLPCLAAQNFSGVVFSNQVTWFVDDTIVHCDTNQETFTAKPNNGCVLMFNPITGDMFMKVIHRSVCAAGLTTLRDQLETAKEVAAFVRSLPVNQQPKQIVLVRRGIFVILKALLLDTIITRCELHFPFQALLKMEKLGVILRTDTSHTTDEPLTVLFNMYDDWLKTMPSHTAFSRLNLILRALDVNSEKAEMVLKPTDSTVVTEPHHIWPSFTRDQWLKVEVALGKLILSEYAKARNVNVSTLSRSQVHDILLGITQWPNRSLI